MVYMNRRPHRKYNPRLRRRPRSVYYNYRSLCWFAGLPGPAVSIVKTAGLTPVLAMPFPVALVTDEPTTYECDRNRASSSPQDSRAVACRSVMSSASAEGGDVPPCQVERRSLVMRTGWEGPPGGSYLQLKRLTNHT